jgi:Tol biopolymer transport system component
MKTPPFFFIAVLITLTAIGQQVSEPLDRIFYCSFTPNALDIYVSTDGGKSVEKLSDHPALEYNAVISPDGTWVVFTSERSGIPQLYVKSLTGDEEPRRIIHSNSFQDQATFSPDGKTLVFVASHEDNAEIYRIPFVPDSLQDISAARNLTNHPGGDFRPAFSPDGSRIAFSSDRGHPVKQHNRFSFSRTRTGDIYTMDTSGMDVKRLTDTAHWDGSPVWALDGSKIYFYSERGDHLAIYEMNPDGTQQQKLFESTDDSLSPTVLPNGNIAYISSTKDNFILMKFDKASTDTTALLKGGPFNQFNVHTRDNFVIVFHGSEKVEAPENTGAFGFHGQTLATLPDTIVFGGVTANRYGMRRAFIAPPDMNSPLLYYDRLDMGNGPLDILGVAGFSIFLPPALGIILFLSGIIFGVINRKKLKIWKSLLFSLLSLILPALVVALFFFTFAIDAWPVLNIQLVMAATLIILVAFAVWLFRKYQNQEAVSASKRLYAGYLILFVGLGFFALVSALFTNHFLILDHKFFSINYLTNERTELFNVKKLRNTNPTLAFQLLDSKVTPDGNALLFTIGRFTGNPKLEGNIWRYDFATGEQTRISDSQFNDGFAEISEDGKMVFRSGRSGFFDIYLKEGGKLTNLTNDEHKDNFPSISLQGDKIAFASNRLHADDSLKNMDIFLMELQADNTWSVPRKISSGNGQNGHPHFSPDGEWIMYTTEAFGINDEEPLVNQIIFAPQMYGEIVAYNIGTRERFRLTHNKWEEGTPLWVKGIR